MASLSGAEMEAFEVMEDDLFVLQRVAGLVDFACCAEIMAHLIFASRTLTASTIAELCIERKQHFLDMLMRAMRIVGNSAQVLFSWPEPTLEDIIERWQPGLTRQYVGPSRSTAALRYSIIGINMAELWAMELDDPRLLDLATNLLKCCSGAEMTVEFDEHDAVWLPELKHRGAVAEASMFECVVLTLIVLARSHVHWFAAAGCEVTIKLWGQIVPDIAKSTTRPAAAKGCIAKKKVPEGSLALTPQQAEVLRNLKETFGRILLARVHENATAKHLTREQSFLAPNDLVFRTQAVVGILSVAASVRAGKLVTKSPALPVISFPDTNCVPGLRDQRV